VRGRLSWGHTTGHVQQKCEACPSQGKGTGGIWVQGGAPTALGFEEEAQVGRGYRGGRGGAGVLFWDLEEGRAHVVQPLHEPLVVLGAAHKFELGVRGSGPRSCSAGAGSTATGIAMSSSVRAKKHKRHKRNKRHKRPAPRRNESSRSRAGSP